jgi:Kef-type K+ transport system membrane component KefB
MLINFNLLATIPLPVTDPVYIICILLLIVSLAPLIAKELHIPPLVVLIIAGTILGDNTLGIIARDDRLILLEKCGLLYIMFLAGIQIDLSNWQRLGIRALSFGLLTFSVPWTFGVISGHWLGYRLVTILLLGILYSPHTLLSYPIVTKLGIVQQEAVSIAVGGTIVTSLLTLIGLSLLQAIASSSLGIGFAIKIFILLPLLVLVYLWGIPKFGSQILAKSSDSLTTQFVFLLTCLFVAASATLMLGIDAIVGAFLAGLAINPLISLTSPLMNRIEFVGNSLLIPAFLISAGTLCNPQLIFTQLDNLSITLIVIGGAVATKFLAASLAGFIFRFSWAEIMVMFGLSVSRAALVVAIALFGKNAGLLNEGIFNTIILYMIFTCLISPLIVDTFGRQLAEKKSMISIKI